MMKTGFLLVTVLLVASVSGEIPAEVRLKSLQYLTECMKEWNVTFENVAEAIFGANGFPEDQNFKEFSLCMAVKVGLLDKNGSIQKDVVVKSLNYLINSDTELERLYKKCVIPHETAQETAFQVTNCLHLEGVSL